MVNYSVGPELQVLGPGIGYGILAGIGAVFTVVMILTTKVQNRYSVHSTKESEEFNTASRDVKPGLIVAGIVSAWTWSATLLTSCTFAYIFGISGPMWYAALGSSQVLTFSLFSLKVKRETPGAHTFPEIVLARHGKVAHAVYLVYGWVTNLFVGATLVVGGSQVLAGLSGVNVYAACFIIPLAVAAYVIQGGLRSTFVADYLHTVILFVAIFIFAFKIYTTDAYVGSASRFYDLLMEMAEVSPLPGNAHGSWLTFRSNDGLIFAAIIFIGSFSTVWLDQAYWQRAIASKPETSVKAYLLGGLAWYGIPFGIATAMGLGAVALTGSPTFPTYPNPLNAVQIGGGFAAPATAIALMGKNGAALMLLMLFMAVTSATSAELIAVSSLWTFDFYKLYINPKAASSTLVRQAHYSIVAYSLILAAFCCGLCASGIDITWILTEGGVMIGGGGIPLGLILLFPKRMSTTAAIVAPLVACPLGITTWLVTTHLRSGSITVATTGIPSNALAGSATSCGVGLVCAIVLSIIFPYKYKSTDPTHIALVEKISGVASLDGQATMPEESNDEMAVAESGETKSAAVQESTETTVTSTLPEQPTLTGNDVVDFLTTNHIQPLDMKVYFKARRLAFSACAVFFVLAMAVFPFTFYGTGWVFSKAAFTGWVSVSLIWVFLSAVACIFWPLIESYAELKDMTSMLFKDAFRRKAK